MDRIFNWLIALLRRVVQRPKPAQADTANDRRFYIGKRIKFEENQVVAVEVEGTSILVARIEGRLCAVRNQCAHLPVPLEGGAVEDGMIICPFHNSKFDLCSGANLDWTPGVAGVEVPTWTRRLIAMGQEAQGIPSYTVIEDGTNVYLDLPA